jgi:hypothetical protein
MLRRSLHISDLTAYNVQMPETLRNAEKKNADRGRGRRSDAAGRHGRTTRIVPTARLGALTMAS